MKNSLLIELLKSLSKKERKAFKQFVCSPFFNTRPEVSRCYEYIAQSLWVDKIVPDKQQISAHLYPNSPYNDHRIRVLMSFIHKLIEQFLCYNKINEDTIENHLALAQVFRQRKLERHYQRNITHLGTQLNNSQHKNAMHYAQRYNYQLEYYQYTAAQKRAGTLNFQALNQELDTFYFISKLRQACLMLSHQAVFQTEYQLEMLEEVIGHIEKGDWLDIPAVAIYFHCYNALNRPENAWHFQAFKVLLFEQGQQFPPGERQDLYILGINFCTKRYNAGDEAYLSSQLDLYQNGLQQGFLLNEGQLSRYTYRNIVTLGLILKEYQWVEAFIMEYKSFLEGKHRHAMFSFCQAHLAYSKKEYGKTLELLQQSDYRDPLLYLSAKTILIKVFYELDELDPLEAQIGSLKAFLRRRREVISYHKANYQNMIRYLQKILETSPFNKKALQKLSNDIQQETVLAEKYWLLEQLNHLI